MLPIVLLLSLFLPLFPPTLAQPAHLSFTDCFAGDASKKLEVSSVYGQVLPHAEGEPTLNLTVFGTSPTQIVGTGDNLATLFSSTSILTLNAHSSSIYLCKPIRPPSPLPSPKEDINGYNNQSYCPLPAGPFGLSTTTPLGHNRDLSTLTTRIRAVDPQSTEILCLDVSYTPVSPGKYGYVYGEAIIVFWATVAIAIAYWVVSGIARISSAWGRGIRQKHNLWARVESAGFIFASALSGEGFSGSPALLRFCTPSMRDIIFHTQWCSALAMVAVQWPTFTYPILTQTAWSTLVYNITLTSPSVPHRWDALGTQPFEAPTGFADQVNDPTSTLYMDPTASNVLFRLPENATHGMSSFAYTIGVRPEDLWSICMIVFLGIMAGAIALSMLFWLVDWIATFISKFFGGKGPNRIPGTLLSSTGSKDILDSTAIAANAAATNDENKSLGGTPLFRTTSRFTLPLTNSGPILTRKTWWRARPGINSFHTNVLHGNLVRIIILFHLPVTIFSCYEMTRPKSDVAASSIALAGLSFAVFSILVPCALVVRVKLTNTSKLYDETRTLLAFGPLYNHYRHGSQMFATVFFLSNLIFGIAIGCGQKSGTAQAIVILVVEVISALVTSIWLPWGHGASMGLISFLFCVARIVVAVLLVILSPAITIGHGATGWVAYGILVILGLVFLALVLMLIIKIIEAFVRIIGGISFDSSNHIVDSGLLGACGMLGCCGGRRRRPKNKSRGKYRSTPLPRDPPSDGAFYPPSRGDTGKDKESIRSLPTPSVLRPEQAMRPYQEDRDDENGFIMGAWRGTQGYQHIGNTSPASSKPSSGFSRVGGGRAHFDSPYSAIPPQQGTSTPLKQSTIFHQEDELNTIPFNSRGEGQVEQAPVSVPMRAETNDLPPGAMKPLHARTRSQTAIIEDAGSYFGNVTRPEDPKPSHPPSSFNNGEDTKKNRWFMLRRNRPHSAGDDTPSTSTAAEEVPLSAPAGSTSGRSFVVIRDKKPQEPRQRQVSDVGPTSPGLDGAAAPTSSFVVMRKKQAGSSNELKRQSAS